jgi:hypothetical protein
MSAELVERDLCGARSHQQNRDSGPIFAIGSSAAKALQIYSAMPIWPLSAIA